MPNKAFEEIQHFSFGGKDFRISIVIIIRKGFFCALREFLVSLNTIE